MHVLVTGATGFIGRRLVPALQEADHELSVLVRDAESYPAPPDVRVIEGDLLDPAEIHAIDTGTVGLEAVLSDIDVAYYLVHSMGTGGDFEARDRRAAKDFATAATAAGVNRIIYLGGLGADRDSLSPHLRSRREVEHVLKQAGPPVTVLRAAIIIGQGSTGFEMIRQLAARLPVMVTPKWVQTECQPIAVDDVIAYLTGVLDDPATTGETYEIGGPTILTYGEILKRTARLMGHREPLLIPVPVLSPTLSSYWVDLVTDVPESVARPLILGLKNPVVVTDDSIRDHLPIDLLDFDTAVNQALAREPAPQ